MKRWSLGWWKWSADEWLVSEWWLGFGFGGGDEGRLRAG